MDGWNKYIFKCRIRYFAFFQREHKQQTTTSCTSSDISTTVTIFFTVQGWVDGGSCRLKGGHHKATRRQKKQTCTLKLTPIGNIEKKNPITLNMSHLIHEFLKPLHHPYNEDICTKN